MDGILKKYIHFREIFKNSDLFVESFLEMYSKIEKRKMKLLGDFITKKLAKFYLMFRFEFPQLLIGSILEKLHPNI